MADWQATASRALTLLADETSDSGETTKCMINHVLDESNLDNYISKDFFNVQQTAGGLPETVSFEQFLQLTSGHVRDDFQSSSFDDDISDDDFKTALLSIDGNIRRHIRFLNGVVHQIAPGELHLGLWNLILESRGDDRSVYACYRDFLVDA
jgi:hypothetical protein